MNVIVIKDRSNVYPLCNSFIRFYPICGVVKPNLERLSSLPFKICLIYQNENVNGYLEDSSGKISQH